MFNLNEAFDRLRTKVGDFFLFLFAIMDVDDDFGEKEPTAARRSTNMLIRDVGPRTINSPLESKIFHLYLSSGSHFCL